MFNNNFFDMATKRKQTFNTFTDNDSAVNNYFNNKKREVTTPAKSSKSISAEMELIMKRKRSNILNIATKTGIKEANSWTKFNTWMKKSSIYKKELHAYSFDQLDDLHRQFRQLESNFDESAKKVGNKAWHHATGIPSVSEN